MDRRDFLRGVAGAAAAAALPAIPLAAAVEAAPEFLYAYPTPVATVKLCHTVFWCGSNLDSTPTGIWRSKECACCLPEGPTKREA